MDIYGYFVITDNFETCPAWVQSENYFNCENFSRFFRFFKKKIIYFIISKNKTEILFCFIFIDRLSLPLKVSKNMIIKSVILDLIFFTLINKRYFRTHITF